MSPNDLVERVDLGFRLVGPPVPVDHGYALFGALARVLGDLHGADWLAVHPLSGQPLPGGRLALHRRGVALRLRVPPAAIPRVLPLAGATLELDGQRLLVGVSQVFALRPAPALAARLVTIKGFTEEDPFADAVRRQLEALGVSAEVEVGRRRVVTVAGDRVVGFATRLRGLAPDASLRVQCAGVGGRQRMGCGIFVPITHERSSSATNAGSNE